MNENLFTPTYSEALQVQMAGRSVRPDPNTATATEVLEAQMKQEQLRVQMEQNSGMAREEPIDQAFRYAMHQLQVAINTYHEDDRNDLLASRFGSLSDIAFVLLDFMERKDLELRQLRETYDDHQNTLVRFGYLEGLHENLLTRYVELRREMDSSYQVNSQLSQQARLYRHERDRLSTIVLGAYAAHEALKLGIAKEVTDHQAAKDELAAVKASWQDRQQRIEHMRKERKNCINGLSERQSALLAVQAYLKELDYPSGSDEGKRVAALLKRVDAVSEPFNIATGEFQKAKHNVPAVIDEALENNKSVQD